MSSHWNSNYSNSSSTSSKSSKYEGAISNYIKNYGSKGDAPSESEGRYNRVASYDPKYAEEKGYKKQTHTKTYRRPTSSRAGPSEESSSSRNSSRSSRGQYDDSTETRSRSSSSSKVYTQAKTPYDLLQQSPVLKQRGHKIKKYIEREKENLYVLPREPTRGTHLRGYYKSQQSREALNARREHTSSIQKQEYGEEDSYEEEGIVQTARSNRSEMPKPAPKTRTRSVSSASQSSKRTYKQPSRAAPVRDTRYHDYEEENDDAYMEFSSESPPSRHTSSRSSSKSHREPSQEYQTNAPSANPATAQGWDEVPEYVETQSLTPCSLCGRKFNADRIQKHMKICSKSKKAASKRKKFDVKSMRQVDEAKKVDRSSTLRAKMAEDRKKARQKAKLPKWKEQHLQFQSVLKAGSGEAPPVVDNRIPCPHCNRKFSETAAERHIPRCANIQNRPKPFRRR
mmetsp:Transcript_6748/g.9805  ORF Transcript_6748/g.9805 Transcript_6748/m.9805 type:complete len:454 (-) Transcript_6748:74-1435(-)|eukprot:CAMPEP_0117429084 /NCGR_PEP_ID=MMETSP0758-20121206/8658_1 /TAXON_ID=63605 /ORGANISM="Percolomonas cosmopolitus, Strain AE-1 (ATCC 50343)" /LENGTH=453 /DNA_ID=CAMNT_0005215819 /DNA_START=11 /DNA_END=1372 /DNA_ORIENTATION=-